MRLKIFILLSVFTLSYLSSFSQWVQLNSGTNITLQSVHFPTSEIGYVTGSSSNGIVLKTINSGDTWFSVFNYPGVSFFSSVYFTNSDTGYVVGISGYMIRTQDGGVNWDTLNTGVSNTLTNIRFLDDTTGYAVGMWGTIIKTIDGGNSWFSLPSGFGQQLDDIYFTSYNNGYAVGNGGTILHTTDSGNTWSPQNSNVSDWLYGIDFINDSVGHIIGASGNYLTTSDSGNTWTVNNLGSQSNIFGIHFYNDSSGVIVGAQFGEFIRKTVNSGNNWNPQSSGVGEPLYEVFFPNDTLGFAVGQEGTIIRFGNPSIITSMKSVLKKGEYNIYPNPTTGSFTVELGNQVTDVKATLTNSLGQVFFTKNYTSTNIIELEIEGPTGIYFLQLETDNSSQVIKILKE